MKTYSMDLRERVVAAVDHKERNRVSQPWVGKLLGRRRRTGSIAPRPRHTGGPPALDAKRLTRLRSAAARTPEAIYVAHRPALAAVAAADCRGCFCGCG